MGLKTLMGTSIDKTELTVSDALSVVANGIGLVNDGLVMTRGALYTENVYQTLDFRDILKQKYNLSDSEAQEYLDNYPR